MSEDLPPSLGGWADRMLCIAPSDGHVPNQQTIQNEVTVEQPATCRVCRATHSVGQHYESDLQEGE